MRTNQLSSDVCYKDIRARLHVHNILHPLGAAVPLTPFVANIFVVTAGL
jgi:hypothetical protein